LGNTWISADTFIGKFEANSYTPTFGLGADYDSGGKIGFFGEFMFTPASFDEFTIGGVDIPSEDESTIDMNYLTAVVGVSFRF